MYVPGGRYDYLTLSGKEHVHRLTSDWTNKNTLSHIQVTIPQHIRRVGPSEHQKPYSLSTVSIINVHVRGSTVTPSAVHFNNTRELERTKITGSVMINRKPSGKYCFFRIVIK